VRVEVDHFLPQLAIEPGHDCDDENEHGHSQGYAENRNEGDDGKKRSLRFQIPQGQKKTKRQFQFGDTVAANGPIFQTLFRIACRHILSSGILPAMRKCCRLLFAFVCIMSVAASILTFLFAGFLVGALMFAWITEGRLRGDELGMWGRGVAVMLISAGVIWGVWSLSRRVFGTEAFGLSFKQVSSPDGRRELIAMNVSTAAMLVTVGILVYERAAGKEWMRLFEVVGCLVLVFAGMHLRVLVHELGHLWMALGLGMRRSKIQVGTGRLLWGYLSQSGVRWEWRMWPQLGLVFARQNARRGFKWRQIAFVAAGPFVDLLMIYLGYVLIAGSFGGLAAAFTHSGCGIVVFILFWLTASSAVNGLIPHKVHFGLQKIYTDGYWLARLLLLSDADADAFVRRKEWEQFEDLARQARIYFETSGESSS
jgi:Peptidase family M50